MLQRNQPFKQRIVFISFFCPDKTPSKLRLITLGEPQSIQTHVQLHGIEKIQIVLKLLDPSFLVPAGKRWAKNQFWVEKISPH